MFVLALVSIVACNQQTKKNSTKETKVKTSSQSTGDKPKIHFTESEHDFGELVAGETVTYAFKFSNSGGADLIISNVRTTCGCTVSDFPKEPIKPGESGVIKLTFDSRGRQGYQNKTATVTSNASNQLVVLRLKATVKNS